MKTRIVVGVLLAALIIVGMLMNVAPIRAQSQPPVETAAAAARDAVNKGVSSFRAGKYEEAVHSFQAATELDPTMTTAYLYLATAYARRYVPEAQSNDNKKYAELAIQTFSKILEEDPRNVNAVAGLASIY